MADEIEKQKAQLELQEKQQKMMEVILAEMEMKIVGGAGEVLKTPKNQEQAEELMHRQSFKMKREKNLELEKQRVQKQEQMQQEEK